MNFLEALQEVHNSDGKLWAHPVNTYGWGIAWKDRDWVYVPSDRGGEPVQLPSPIMLFDYVWEAVSPKEIFTPPLS